MRKNLLISLFITMNATVNALNLDYTIRIDNPGTHYASVRVDVHNIQSKEVILKMPVWTPGSYMVREFGKNIERVFAEANGKNLEVIKTDKSSWKILNPGKLKDITVSYRVYCFEQSVRTSYIDTDHAFLLMSSCLLYADGQGAGKLTFDLAVNWSQISCTLETESQRTFLFSNYDELADSPVEIGNHMEFGFEVAGVKHRVAMVGSHNSNLPQFKADLEKICNTMYQIMDVHPCKSYLFIVHHVEEGGGGLEHANSSVVQMPRFNYSNREKYLNFLSLCAHEYFHLWNVKRIRPAALGPFDYSKENYTNLLWVAEGITSYYDELAMYRAGFRTEAEYLKILSGTISNTLNRKGAEVQSMHEASFDAWIKEYRPNENSINSTISYYTKGSVLAALLDIELLNASNGERGLDDLLKYLYKTYHTDKNKGFTDDEFYAAIDHIAGRALGFKVWCEHPNDGRMLERITHIFSKAACVLSNNPSGNKHYTGINTELKGEKLLVKSIDALSPAYGKDIQSGDELIALNGLRLKSNLEDLVKICAGEEPLKLLISRAGIIREILFQPIQSTKLDISIQIENRENTILKAWLKK